MPTAKTKSIKPAPGHERDLAAARRVLQHAADAISALALSLNGDFSRAIDTILGVGGRIIVSGTKSEG